MVAGLAGQRESGKPDTRRMLLGSLLFVAGFAVVFMVLGYSPTLSVLYAMVVAVLLSFLLRVPCRVPEWSVDSRFPGLCAAELQPGDLSVTPGGMLSGFFTGGPTGDQPIVVGMFTSILGWMTTGLAEAFSFEITPNTVLDLTVFLTALVWVVTITAVASLSGKQPSDPVVLAFAPTVLLVGFTSWDLWAVMFMMLAVASYIRGSPGVAGVWVGLGATVSFLPLLVLIAILFLLMTAPIGAHLLGRAAAWRSGQKPDLLIRPSDRGKPGP